MDTNEVFDRLFKDYPSAWESKSLNSQRPKGDLKWKKHKSGAYSAVGPRGGVISVAYNARSNKITIRRGA